MKNLSKKALIIIGSIILIIFFVPLFRGIFNIGNQFGMALGIALIFCGIFIEKLKQFIKKLCSKKLGKALVCTTFSVFIIFMLAFTITFSVVTANAFSKDNVSGTVIVLGCQVRGNVPSLQLSQRITAAKEVLNTNKDSSAVLSGGQGFGEEISEAQCMYERLTNMGVSADRLYLESSSVSTETNLQNSLKIIEENSLDKNVCIISSNYHLYRAKIMAKQMGFDSVEVYPAHTNIYAYPTYAAREVFAIWYLILFG